MYLPFLIPTLSYLLTRAAVDVLVIVLAALAQVALLIKQHLRYPGIIFPADTHDFCGIGWIHDKPLIRFIAFQFRIEAHPNLRVLFANRWDENVPRALGERLRFFHPSYVAALVRFQVACCRLPDAGENELSAIASSNAGLCHIVVVAKPKHGYLVAQELVN